MQPLLALHIAAGTLGVAAGAAALALPKGARAHRAAGVGFVVAQSVMAATAAVLGKDFQNILAGGLSLYMVWTGWMTVRATQGRSRRFEAGAFIVALVCALGMGASMALIASGAQKPSNPYILGIGSSISGALALAAIGDLSLVVRRNIPGPQRIARHLWRMCFGLLIAVGAFAAQGAEALPRAIPRALFFFTSMIVVLLIMAFLLVRVLGSRGTSQAASRPVA